MKSLLVEWALKFNICQNSLNGLVIVLRDPPFNHSTLPKDARTIMKTQNVNNMIQTISIDPGEYYHFGLAVGLQKVLNNFINVINEEDDTIEIVIGIDGLPISKSSSSQFWPILGNSRPYKSVVFIIGLYWGYSKPKDSNKYLEKFVNETKLLLKDGVFINHKYFNIQISGFCLDAPVKSFILQTKGHSGFNSCTRCTQEGDYLENRICFPYVVGGSVPRSHDDYITKKHIDHHVVNSSLSILKDLPNIDIVKSFSLDYMHLICLGVMRKLINLWMIKGPLNVRLHSAQIKEISASLLKLKPFVTCDFSRKPRGLEKIHRWKATEFRQFLLYTGPLVLKTVLK